MIEVSEVVIAIIIVLLIVLIVFYVYWYTVGWSTALTFKNGDTVQIAVPYDSDITKMRFKNCKFSMDIHGKTYTQDVSHALNYYVKSFKDSKTGTVPETAPKTLLLPAGLNPFSFVIPNVNNLPGTDPTKAPWCTVTTPCTGDADCAKGRVMSGSNNSLGPCVKPGYSTYNKCPDTDSICKTPTGPGPKSNQITATNYNYPVCVTNAGKGKPGCVYAYSLQGTCSLCTTTIPVTLTVQYKFL